MTRNTLVRGLLVGTALAVLWTALPAAAQNMRGIRGRVVDEGGQPVGDAEVLLVLVGDNKAEFKTKTRSNGEFIYAAIPASYQGTWNVVITKGELGATMNGVPAQLGGVTDMGDVVVRKGAAVAPEAARMSAEEIERINEERRKLNELFATANQDIEAGNLDAAVEKINAVMQQFEACAQCHLRLGDIYRLKKDLATAEREYLEAIKVDPNLPGPYEALSTLYNAQGKFEQAAEMNKKASELLAASGAAGGDAVSTYNQGIILWNQGKIAEAKAQFEAAWKADPNMADAHYWYGMALVNEGNLAGAKEPLNTYLKLAPTGANAETAKAILSQIP
jgi:tetratricopeptide (TPR) repeat protein